MVRTLAVILALLWTGMVNAQPVIPLTQASVAITVSTNTTTKLVSNVIGQAIYVTSWMVIAAGTTNVQLVYGTGSNCASNQVVLTGNYQLTAQVGAAFGDGTGIILVVPIATAALPYDLCIVNSANIAIPGSLSYARF